MWRKIAIPYFAEIGRTLAHDKQTDDDRLYVDQLAKQIVRVTAHGNEGHHDYIQDFAKKIKNGQV